MQKVAYENSIKKEEYISELLKCKDLHYHWKIFGPLTMGHFRFGNLKEILGIWKKHGGM